MIKLNHLLESFASETASRLGLSYMGFGRWGREGQVTHISKFGRLVSKTAVPNVRTLHNDELKHLEHADDEVFNHGARGVVNVLDQFNAIRHGDNRTVISQKIDGSPSFVMGTHPSTGKFFVGSKSIFNKDPKINYTEEDIDRNHGHAPGLAAKLKQLLRHGHKLGIKGIVQGDFLYDKDDLKFDSKEYSFQPNTIRYSIDKKHPEGSKIGKSKIGIALHTRYNDESKAELDPNIEHTAHPDVYVMPVKVGNREFDHDLIRDHVKSIGSDVHKIPSEGWSAISHDSILPHIKTYINSEVRMGNDNYSVDALKTHIQNKYDKEMSKIKTEKGKEGRRQTVRALLDHIDNNRNHFDTAFRIQSKINKVKHHIIDKLDSNQTFRHTYSDGSQAAPEGYVAIGHHGPLKLVNRSKFSRANFEMSKNR